MMYVLVATIVTFIYMRMTRWFVDDLDLLTKTWIALLFGQIATNERSI